MKKFSHQVPPKVPASQATIANLQDWANGIFQWGAQFVGKVQALTVTTSDIPAFQDSVSPANELSYLRVSSSGQTIEARTAADVLGDIGAAALNGDATENFSVKDATTSHQAVAYDQVHNVSPVSAANVGGSITTLSATTASLTAPCGGFAYVSAIGVTTAAINNVSLSASLGALSGKVTEGTNPSAFGAAYLTMTSGQSSTFTWTVGTSSSATINIIIFVFFVPTP